MRDMQVVDARSLHSWIKHAKRGDRYSYHEGLLMRDRLYSPRGEYVIANSALNNMAGRIYDLYLKGEVLLFQKRVMDGVSEYIMVKR